MTVQFHLPNGWRASTPWQPISDRRNAFSVDDANDLTEAFILAGTHDERRINLDRAEMTVAVGGEMKPAAPLLCSSAENVLNAFTNLFGEVPETRKLLVANLGYGPGSMGGGLFNRSISLLIGDKMTLENRSFWGQFVAHELFHIWNGAEAILVEIAGKPVRTHHDILIALADRHPGETVSIVLLRDGQNLTLERFLGGTSEEEYGALVELTPRSQESAGPTILSAILAPTD